MRALVVHLQGGLGNQMFQYATARALAQRCGATLWLDERELGGPTSRPAGLHRWRIDARPAVAQMLRAYPRWKLRLSRRAPWLGALWGVHCETSPAFKARLASARPPALLSGYFQCERYFADIRPLLLQQFRPKAPLPGPVAELAQELASTTSVSVHVRRGDYVSNPEAARVHGVCGAEYYTHALRRLRALVRVDRCVIFSDDPAWAREHLDLPVPAVFVDGHADAPEVDMHLMSLCRHHVCSNSSFGWWGAWLDSRPDKLVVAPSRWYADPRLQDADIVPPSWIRT